MVDAAEAQADDQDNWQVQGPRQVADRQVRAQGHPPAAHPLDDEAVRLGRQGIRPLADQVQADLDPGRAGGDMGGYGWTNHWLAWSYRWA